MTDMKRKSIITIAVLTLVVLNIWRWWPVSAPQSVTAGRTGGEFNVEDFDVKAIPVDSLPPLARDIFVARKVEVVKHRVATQQSANPSLPAKSPEETARDSAQAEFAQIQCVGISVRKDRVQAYLISAGEPSLVSDGDKVGSRFVVDKIVPEGVTLRDPETGVGGLIPVSGKK